MNGDAKITELMEAEILEDGVSPSEELGKQFFKHGYTTWSRHLHTASSAPRETRQSFLWMVDHAFPNHPTLPSSLHLTKSSTAWLATGSSTWGGTPATISTSTPTSTTALCPGLPALPPQKRSFVVTKRRPTKLSVAGNGSGHHTDHLTVLVLAWAYILSARWTEIISDANPIQYTETHREEASVDSHSTIPVPIGTVNREAWRWWKAILSAGQGWQATATNSDGSTLHSPWSIRLSSDHVLLPRFDGDVDPPTTTLPPDSTTALAYLAEYCVLYNLHDESRAALSTVLFLPLRDTKGVDLRLPRPPLVEVIPGSLGPYSQAAAHRDCLSLKQVDRLMALSCNTRGLEALLLSTFFDADVPCNAVSPFLQGTFAVLDSVGDDRHLLVGVLMHSRPTIGFLWTGAMISGVHAALLDKAQYGSFDADLLTAAWTDTIQTFMQLPVCMAQDGRVRRDDECRLAYLASHEYQFSIPMSPWKPFGTTAIKDAELDVQIHMGCKGHCLQYRGWAWNCWKDEALVHASYQPPVTVPAPSIAPPLSLPPLDPPIDPEIPYDKLCPQQDAASCTSTLNIFIWLRRGGFPASEQHIRRHEWLCEVLDEEEEEECESELEDDDETVTHKRAKSQTTKTMLSKWLAAQISRESSI